MFDETQITTTNMQESAPTQKQSKTGLIMILMFLLGLGLVYVIKSYVAQVDAVDGQSMEPTLHQGQYMFIDRMVYRFQEPKYGEVVAVQWGANGIIKRVIGLPGDKIEVKDGSLYRNGQKQEEPYIKEVMTDKYGPMTVPKGSIFILGDNRNESRDSRSFGPVPIASIIGRADAVLYPFSQYEVQPFGLVANK